jgi:hypothetical protein
VGVLRIGGDDPESPPLPALQIVLAHQAADALLVHRTIHGTVQPKYRS